MSSDVPHTKKCDKTVCLCWQSRHLHIMRMRRGGVVFVHVVKKVINLDEYE
jgi:hypothetical protein